MVRLIRIVSLIDESKFVANYKIGNWDAFQLL